MNKHFATLEFTENTILYKKLMTKINYPVFDKVQIKIQPTKLKNKQKQNKNVFSQ